MWHARILAVTALVLAGCHRPQTSNATAVDAAPSVGSAMSPVAPSGSASAVAKPAAPVPPPKPTFAAKATGSFDGIAWKPTFATVSVRDGEATLAIWDAPTPTCAVDATDTDLQFLVNVTYAVGKTTQLASLKRANANAKTPDAFLGEVSLLSHASKKLATRYTGSVELTAAPEDTSALAHAKVDVHADGVALRGELDAIVCLFE